MTPASPELARIRSQVCIPFFRIRDNIYRQALNTLDVSPIAVVNGETLLESHGWL